MNFRKINLILSIVFLTNSINCGFEQVINLLKNNKKAVAIGLTVTASIYFLKKYADKLKMDDINRCNEAIERDLANEFPAAKGKAKAKAEAEAYDRAKDDEENRKKEQAKLKRKALMQECIQKAKADLELQEKRNLYVATRNLDNAVADVLQKHGVNWDNNIAKSDDHLENLTAHLEKLTDELEAARAKEIEEARMSLQNLKKPS